jgi:hypothetical protein
MSRSIVFVSAFFVSVLVTTATAGDFRGEFKSNYDNLTRQVLDREGEVASIDSFTYEKDVATFHFGKGVMLFQRPVNGRPTVAIFVGKGHAHIDIPVAAEREAYKMITRDTNTVVEEDFEICLMRVGDDFDTKLKGLYTFVPGGMSLADFGRVRDAQLEYYFKPNLAHWTDNQLELLISVYERKTDGYFWAGFNHTYFTFDPNAPEEVFISHMREPEFALTSAGPHFQRREKGRYDVAGLSRQDIPTELLERGASVYLGGSTGWTLDSSQMHMTARVLRDSLKFVSLFLDPKLEPDSVTCNGVKTDYFRRRDFFHMVLLLQNYVQIADSLRISMWFHNEGEDYDRLQPGMYGDRVPLNSISLTYLKGYNYALPGSTLPREVDKKHEVIEAGPVRTHNLGFQAMPTGFDTSVVDVDGQLRLTFIALKRKPWSEIKRDEYQRETKLACRYFMKTYGVPIAGHEWYVFPEGISAGYGMFGLPLYREDTALGGFRAVVGDAVARAWISPFIQTSSYRESWLSSTIAEYVGLLYTQQVEGSKPLYQELFNLKKGFEYTIDAKIDLPLVAGPRGNRYAMRAKGLWLIHMLRVLLFDTESLSDQKFNDFLKELIDAMTHHPITTAEVCAMAEKYFEGPLDWFFEPWLYGRNMPTFDGTYSIETEGNQYWVAMHVATTGVDSASVYPVMIRVNTEQGTALLRQAIAGTTTDYRIGPFGVMPTKVVFNEYSSVMCKAEVKER